MRPLAADSKRQAVPALRGYSYQIWQSLWRWLDLKENEDLFLEGAEDVDVLRPGESAETVQIKDTAESGSITLRSADVLEAINNFWEHQKNNPQTTIRFRFLTTSERGRERPKAFDKMRGLDFWDACKRTGADVQPLRDFLVAQNTALSEDLREFIGTAADDELREKLFTRIEWDTGRKAQPHVEELVRRKVVEYGDAAHRLPASVSEKIIPHLLEHVWCVVLREAGEERRLTRADFLTVFEEATTEKITAHELSALRRAAENAQAAGFSVSGGAGSSATSFGEAILEPLSPLDLSKFAGRAELAAELRDKLNETGFLTLVGSTGMGKSQLSNLVADLVGSNWRRLDFRGLAPEQIKDRLVYAAHVVESGADQTTDLIVDDLNFDRQPRVYENALGRLLYALKMRDQRVIVTGHHAPPSRLVNLHEIREDSLFAVPPFDETEVQELLAKHGCPLGHKLKAWSRLIFLQARGHPLLTHARVRAAANEGWRSPSREDFLIPSEEIKDVRQEFRRVLREQVPEDARTLLYRLSIFSQRFKRRQALALGVHPPPISGAGDAFDALVGPWVEAVDAVYYRLSPLLDGAATEVFTEGEVKELHRAATRSLLEKEISVVEFSGLLFHGLAGEAAEPLASAAMSVFNADKSGWQEIAQIAGWFAYARLVGNQKLFEGNDFTNFLLRRVQFKMMIELDPQKAVEVAEIIDREIDEWQEGGDVSNSTFPGTKNSSAFTFLNDVILEMQVPFTVRQIAERVLRVIPLAQSPGAFFPEHPEHQAALEEKIKPLATANIYARAAVARCRRAEDVIELLGAFDEAGETPAGREVWTAFKTDNLMASTLADAVWLGEIRSGSETRDWNARLETLDRVINIAGRRKADALVAAAHQAKAIIYEEYLHDADSAFRTLAEGENALGAGKVEEAGGAQFFLQDYRAKIFYFEKKYGEALEIWRQILPHVAEDRNAARSFSFRDAEICAARLGNWGEAAEFALCGEEAARLPWIDGQPAEFPPNVVSEAIAVGFRADYAFALWKNGEKALAVKEFRRVLDSFKTLPSVDDDPRVRLLYARVGHAIGWMLRGDDPQIEIQEPPPGFFSNPEKFDEIKEAPLQPIINFWYPLARIEYKLRAGDEVFRRLSEEMTETASLGAKMVYQDLRIRHALRKLEVENLVSFYLEFSRATRAFSAENGISETPDDAESLKALTFTTLLLFVSRRQQHLLPLAEWRLAAAKEEDSLRSSFEEWLDLVEEFIASDQATQVAALASHEASSERRILGALMLSAADDVLDPETRFYADAILLTADFSREWRNLTEDVVEFWTVTNWRKISAQRGFTLQNPNVTAPAILAACDASCSGLNKAANVLLAARPAVRLSVSETVVAQLRTLANDCY